MVLGRRCMDKRYVQYHNTILLTIVGNPAITADVTKPREVMMTSHREICFAL